MSSDGTIYLVSQKLNQKESEKYQSNKAYSLYRQSKPLEKIMDMEHDGKLVYAFHISNYKLAWKTINKILHLKYKSIKNDRIIGEKKTIILDIIKVEKFFEKDKKIYENYRISQIVSSCED